MKPTPSPFYPPRAPWYGSFRYSWSQFKHTLRLHKLQFPGGISLGSMVLRLAVPGYAFWALGHKKVGCVLGCGFFAAVLPFFALIGSVYSLLALGLMFSVHVISVTHLSIHWLESPRLRTRVALTMVTILVLYALVYSPFRQLVENHLALPLSVNGRIIVVKPGPAPKALKPGEFVAYRMDGVQTNHLYLPAGYGYGPIQALAGDHVTFRPAYYDLNGQTCPRAPHMPVTGEWVVPEKHWFIWPGLARIDHGNVAETDISAILLRAAMVSETQYVGRPYRHWFGRRQIAL